MKLDLALTRGGQRTCPCPYEYFLVVLNYQPLRRAKASKEDGSESVELSEPFVLEG
jgi:hypothetical protein